MAVLWQMLGNSSVCMLYCAVCKGCIQVTVSSTIVSIVQISGFTFQSMLMKYFTFDEIILFLDGRTVANAWEFLYMLYCAACKGYTPGSFSSTIVGTSN